MKIPFFRRRYCGWTNSKGSRIIVNFKCKINVDLKELISKMIINSEINDDHKLSFWKKLDDF